MYKIGIVGDKDSILGFKALGLEVVPVLSPEQAKQAVRRLAKQGFGIIFLTEGMALEMEETLESYRDKQFPIITLIPDNQGSRQIGMNEIRKAVEKAVGADILFQREG